MPERPIEVKQLMEAKGPTEVKLKFSSTPDGVNIIYNYLFKFNIIKITVAYSNLYTLYRVVHKKLHKV